MKNIISNILLYSAISISVFTSCSNDDEIKAEANSRLLEIEVLENTQTRATSPLYNSIPNKANYGIYLADNDYNIASNCNNIPVYYYEGSSSVSQAVELNSSDKRVYAYYPYDSHVNPSDLELEGVMAGKDVMIGKSVEIKKDGSYSSGYVYSEMNKAYLKLTHAKSCITFNINQEQTWTRHKIEKVSVQVPARYTGVNLFTGKYVGSTDADITPNTVNAYTTANEYVGCNFLLAPTVKEGDIIATLTIDGKDVSMKLPINYLTPGLNYIFKITIKRDTTLIIEDSSIVKRDEKSSSSVDWEIEY